MNTPSRLVSKYAPTFVALGAIGFDRIGCLVEVLANGISDDKIWMKRMYLHDSAGSCTGT